MGHVQREDGRKLYYIKLAYKEPPHARRVYRAVCDPANWVDLHASEDEEVGEPARYAQWLSDEEVERIQQMRPTNLQFMEPAHEVYQSEQVESEGIVSTPEINTYGVERRALEKHGFFDRVPYNGQGVYVMVADTGYHPHPYLQQRVKYIWEFTGEGRKGRTDNLHGPWCLGAAIPSRATGVSAKVLKENGTGISTDIIAAWMRFRKFCLKRGAKGVISCSIGGIREPSQAYADAAQELYQAGIILVCASGNEGRRDGIDAPANTPGAVSVGAVDYQGNPAYFANRSSTWSKPDLWACGVDVLGVGGRMSGTSMATPLVARAAANLQSVPGYPGMYTPRRRLIAAGGKKKILHEGAAVRALRRHG